MSNVLEVIGKQGKRVYLSKERWKHISKHHPNVNNLHDIEETVKNPISTISDEEEGIVAYFRHFKLREGPAKYLKVVVKYLNGEGYIITSYYVKSLT